MFFKILVNQGIIVAMSVTQTVSMMAIKKIKSMNRNQKPNNILAWNQWIQLCQCILFLLLVRIMIRHYIDKHERKWTFFAYCLINSRLVWKFQVQLCKLQTCDFSANQFLPHVVLYSLTGPSKCFQPIFLKLHS